MSAINAIVRAPFSVHMIVDSLSYANGIPIEVDAPKSHIIRGMRAAVACTGPVTLGLYLSLYLAEEFNSFDDLIADGGKRIKELFQQHVRLHRLTGDDDAASCILIGWHEREDRPAAYSIEMHIGTRAADFAKANSRHQNSDDICSELTELPIIASPCPSVDELRAANFCLGSDLDTRSAEEILMHLTEIQRRMRMSDGNYYVGGSAVLTTVSEAGVTQRTVRTWPEDKPGEVIKPTPMDWATMRAARTPRKAA